MATFTKLSLRRMIIMPIVTGGLYFWRWLESSGVALNEAGGKIPNWFLSFVLFSFLPCDILWFTPNHPANIYLVWFFIGLSLVLPCYYWFRYVQAYVKIVKKSSAREEFVYYLAAAILPYIISWGVFFLGFLILKSPSFNDINQDLANLFIASRYLDIISSSSSRLEFGVFLLILALTYLLNLVRMLIFQKGFNEYKE